MKRKRFLLIFFQLKVNIIIPADTKIKQILEHKKIGSTFKLVISYIMFQYSIIRTNLILHWYIILISYRTGALL